MEKNQERLQKKVDENQDRMSELYSEIDNVY